MRDIVAPECSIVQTRDGVSYELPDWQAGRSRRVTVVGLWGGLLFCCGLMFTIPIMMTWSRGMPLEPVFVKGFLLVVSPANFVGLVLLYYAARGTPRRDRIEVTSRGIGVVWQVGHLRRSRTVPWHEVVRLAVEPAGNEPFFANAEGNYILWLVRRRRTPIRLAGAQDRSRLLGLAEDLAERSKALRSDSDRELALSQAIEIVEEPPRDVIAEREVQPPGSAAIVEQFSDGVTITIPPMSWEALFNAPGFTIALAILTAFWAWIATDAIEAAGRSGHFVLFPRDGSLVAWPCALVASLVVIHIVSRRAQITAKEEALTIRSKLLAGTRLRSWRREQLAGINVISKLVDSDTGQQWTQYLQIEALHSGTIRQHRVLHWRDKAELEWIATTLRRTLLLPAAQSKEKAATEDSWSDEVA